MKRDCAVRKFRMRVADEREKERRKGNQEEKERVRSIMQEWLLSKTTARRNRTR